MQQKSLLALTLLCSVAYGQFSEGGKQSVVSAHNSVRSKIAKGSYVARGIQKPSAKNMMKLSWDSALATSAQNYANTCPTQHSTLQSIGENLYWYWSGSISNLDQFGPMATAAWESEFQQFGWASNRFTTALFNTGIGHASQLAWALTNKIGCGVKNCGADASRGGLQRVSVVCHYKIQGNYLFKNIYDSGATCSACPSGTSCEQSSGLCA